MGRMIIIQRILPDIQQENQPMEMNRRIMLVSGIDKIISFSTLITV